MTDQTALALSEDLLYPTAIDSLQLYIPYQVDTIATRASQQTADPVRAIPVEVVDTRLTDNLITYYEDTGEIHSIKKHQPVSTTHRGIPQGYKLEHEIIGNQSILYISVAISSKLLSSCYLQGITIDNIYQVYQSIISHNIISITYDDFLKCSVRSADLKYDTVVPDIAKAFQTLQSNLRSDLPDLQTPKRSRITGKYQTHGIQVGGRYRGSKRFIKFYNKINELQTNSNEFYEKHLQGLCPDNLLRTEITFNRKKLIQSFPNYTGTLHSLLVNTQLTGLSVMTQILTQDIFTRPSVRKVSSIVPPDETDPSEALANQKLAEQISRIINLCLNSSPQMTLQDTITEVIEILKPGINKRAKVRRFTEVLFVKALEQEVINEQVRDTLHL